MAKQKEVVNETYENAPSDVPEEQLPQSAAWGFPPPSKKADDGVSSTSTQHGTDMDDVDRAGWPEIEELESRGFKD